MGGRTLGILIVAALVPGCGGRSDRDEVVPDPWIDSTYWTHRIGDSNPQHGRKVAVDSGGNVIVAWEFEGSTDIDGRNVPGEVNYPNAVLSRLSAKGRLLWSHVLPGFHIHALEVTVGDRILVAGICDGVVDLGTSPLQPGGCLALLEPDGGAVFTKRFGATWDASVEAITSDAAGIYLAGNFEGSADLGGGPLVSGPSSIQTLFIAKLGFDGAHEWSRAFGQGLPDSIARAPDGSVVVAGRATYETDFGTDPFQDNSLFVAKLTPDGDVSSARALWVTRADNVNGLVASVDGSLYLGGVSTGPSSPTSWTISRSQRTRAMTRPAFCCVWTKMESWFGRRPR